MLFIWIFYLSAVIRVFKMVIMVINEQVEECQDTLEKFIGKKIVKIKFK